MNIVVISGNLGRDPELRFTNDGKAVCEFSIAHNEVHGSGDNRQETVHWIRIVAFGKTAQLVAEHKHQGDEVFVEGSLTYSEWTDTDGNKRTALKVRATKVQFGHRRNTASDEAA
jgi:single-strand DNA-binding protein